MNKTITKNTITTMKRRDNKFYITITGVFVCAIVYIYSSYGFTTFQSLAPSTQQKVVENATCLQQHNMVTNFIHTSLQKSEDKEESSSQAKFAGISSLVRIIKNTNNTQSIPSN